MSSRRDEILREMGLGPVWRLRSAPQRAAVADAIAPPGVEPPAAATPPVGERRAGSRPEAVPIRPDAKADGRGVPRAVDQEERERRIAAADWPDLKACVRDCTACSLHASRTQTVFGVGDEKAEWLLVGEAPGAEEDRLGEPFVGQAGRLLDNMLASIGMERGKNVYIANVLKCRPPANRNPEPGEVARCAPHLLRQIALIRPKLIVAMGRFAAQTLLATDATIASLRGRVHRYAGVPLVVTYHPAYLLRTLPDKSKAWQDLVFARRTVSGS